VDDLQTVIYASKVNEGVFVSGFIVANAYWEQLNELDFQRNPSLFEQQTRSVHLWASQLSGSMVSGLQLAPKMDDRVTDQAGVNWYVTHVGLLDLDSNGVQRFRLICYQGT
jgi:hypothetical protein